MKELDYSIDQKDYDVIVMGTGMTEALFAASLAKIDRKKVLIIDADSGYSSSQKTLNFKELVAEQLKTTRSSSESASNSNLLKHGFFETLALPEDFQTKNSAFIQQAIHESTIFKQFNIDIQPKLLFSTSLTVDCMSQANMDQYMEFRAVDSIYFFDAAGKKLIQTPCSKSDIFKSKEFSLMEKKQLFQFLHKCVTLYRLAFAEKIDQNSIQEFDKEFEVDTATLSRFNELKDKPCMEFLQTLISSKKVQDVFLYNLCNFDFNPNHPIPSFLSHNYTTKSFIYRLNKYIKSCGVHTALPYIYANYGTGDIPQGYARISAIFGSVYCIHPDIEIESIVKDNETKQFRLKSNLIKPQKKEGDEKKSEEVTAAEEGENNKNTTNEIVHELLNVKHIIAGPEYRDRVKTLLDLGTDETVENVKLLRVTVISKKSDAQLKAQVAFDELDLSEEERAAAPYRYSCPIIYSIPPNAICGNQQPIQIVQMDSSTVSAPKSHQVFYCKKVLENAADYMSEVKAIIHFIENIHVYLPAQGFSYEVDYVWAYTQEKTSSGRFERVGDAQNEWQQIGFIGEDYFEADMDKNFEEFRDNIEWISSKVTVKDENYFKTIEEMNGKVDFYQNALRGEGDDADEEQEGIDGFINQFEKLKENANVATATTAQEVSDDQNKEAQEQEDTEKQPVVEEVVNNENEEKGVEENSSKNTETQ